MSWIPNINIQCYEIIQRFTEEKVSMTKRFKSNLYVTYFSNFKAKIEPLELGITKQEDRDKVISCLDDIIVGFGETNPFTQQELELLQYSLYKAFDHVIVYGYKEFDVHCCNLLRQMIHDFISVYKPT
jgi:hypothetical protein